MQRGDTQIAGFGADDRFLPGHNRPAGLERNGPIELLRLGDLDAQYRLPGGRLLIRLCFVLAQSHDCRADSDRHAHGNQAHFEGISSHNASPGKPCQPPPTALYSAIQDDRRLCFNSIKVISALKLERRAVS